MRQDPDLRGVLDAHIAARIEYFPPTIYWNFKNQAELVRALCEGVYGELADVLEEVARTAGSPLARLRPASRDYIDFGFADSTRYRLAFMTSLASHVDASRPSSEGGRRGGQPTRSVSLSARHCARRNRRPWRRACERRGVSPAGPSGPGVKPAAGGYGASRAREGSAA